MAFTFKQSNADSGHTEPINLAYTSNVTAGSLLIACAFWESASATTTITDTKSNVWTPILTAFQGSGTMSTFRIQMFYVSSAASGATTVTMDVSSSVYSQFAILEYGGTNATLDGTPLYGNVASGGTAIVGLGPITTTVAGDLLFLMGAPAGGVPVAGVGFVAREDVDFGNTLAEDKLDAGAAGNKNADYDCGSSGGRDNIIAFAAFKEGAPAGAQNQIAWTVA